MRTVRPPTDAPTAMPAEAPVPKPSLSFASTVEVLKAVVEAVADTLEAVELSL